VADAVLARTPAPTTYARIDLVEFAGAPALMEAELIEPELFLGATAEAAMNFARVLGDGLTLDGAGACCFSLMETNSPSRV
jgi:hypothetical protein